jgi:hypothetical protein
VGAQFPNRLRGRVSPSQARTSIRPRPCRPPAGGGRCARVRPLGRIATAIENTRPADCATRGYGSCLMEFARQALDVEHERILLAATRRSTVAHALGWIAEGHALDDSVSLHAVVEAVLAAERAGANARDAVVAISQRVTRSMLDPATMLFDQELMPSARRLREALDVLASKCSSGSLSSVTATARRHGSIGWCSRRPSRPLAERLPGSGRQVHRR